MNVELNKLKSWILEIAVIIACIVLVLVVTISISGLDLSRAFSVFINSTFGSTTGLLFVLRRATPLIIAAVGLSIAFTASFWNIGAEGQIALGGIATAGVCLFTGLTGGIAIAVAFIASFLFGSGYAGVAAYLKAKWDVNDIVITMLMSLVAIALLNYLIAGPWYWWEGPSGLYSRTAPIPASEQMPAIVYPLNSMFIVAIAISIVAHYFLSKTQVGYKIRMVGDNKMASMVSGINPVKTMTLAGLISGGICAFGGTALVLGEYFRLQGGITGQYGFFAIPIALFCRNKPTVIPFGAFLVAVVMEGALSLVSVGMSNRLSDVLLGTLFIIIFLPELIKGLKRRLT